MISQQDPARQGFTLVEMLVSAGLGSILMTGLVFASIAIQRSVRGTDHYLTSTNNGNRLIDHVAQDLRRAVRVGIISSGTYNPVKNDALFAVSDTVILAINVPDVYASNIPNNSSQSTYKKSRYSRATLNTNPDFNTQATGSILNGCVPYAEAITKVVGKDVLRFAPASVGTGEIQVRYSRGPRSAVDSTICFFRGEYPTDSSTPFAPIREIANQAVKGDVSTNLIVTVPNLPITDSGYGKTFQLESNFVPRYRRNEFSTSTSQHVLLRLRNDRRD